MKIALIKIVQLGALTELAQSERTPFPLDPYPIVGRIYEYEFLENNNDIDTSYIEGYFIFLILKNEIVITTKSEYSGKYELKFPVELFQDNSLSILVECEGYKDVRSDNIFLYGTVYPANGQVYDFNVEKKK